jgi:type II secretory pathway pseudopilin PulG
MDVIKKSRGATLLEVIVALGLLGIIIAAISTFMSDQFITSSRHSESRTQQRVADRIRQIISDPDNIRASIDYGINPSLRDCVYTTGACTATVQGAYANPFDLYQATTDSMGTQSGVHVGGGIHYDKKGEICAAGSVGCVFQVNTYFWATCDFDNTPSRRPLASCSVSRYLNFRFMIRYVPPTAPAGSGPILKDFPPKADFESKITAFAVRMRTADVIQKLDQTCPPNQIVKGIKVDGTPICQCRNGNNLNIEANLNTTTSVIVDPRSNLNLTCGPQQCPNASEIMVGYKPNGDIKCINQTECGNPSSPVYSHCPCFTTAVNSTTGYGDCGTGYWMVNFQFGVCRGVTTKKAGPEVVECDDNEIRCCKLDI